INFQGFLLGTTVTGEDDTSPNYGGKLYDLDFLCLKIDLAPLNKGIHLFLDGRRHLCLLDIIQAAVDTPFGNLHTKFTVKLIHSQLALTPADENPLSLLNLNLLGEQNARTNLSTITTLAKIL